MRVKSEEELWSAVYREFNMRYRCREEIEKEKAYLSKRYNERISEEEFSERYGTPLQRLIQSRM